jgi:hypothetical protein
LLVLGAPSGIYQADSGKLVQTLWGYGQFRYHIPVSITISPQGGWVQFNIQNGCLLFGNQIVTAYANIWEARGAEHWPAGAPYLPRSTQWDGVASVDGGFIAFETGMPNQYGEKKLTPRLWFFNSAVDKSAAAPARKAP